LILGSLVDNVNQAAVHVFCVQFIIALNYRPSLEKLEDLKTSGCL
jgi:hypothetical protein